MAVKNGRVLKGLDGGSGALGEVPSLLGVSAFLKISKLQSPWASDVPQEEGVKSNFSSTSQLLN